MELSSVKRGFFFFFCFKSVYLTSLSCPADSIGATDASSRLCSYSSVICFALFPSDDEDMISLRISPTLCLMMAHSFVVERIRRYHIQPERRVTAAKGTIGVAVSPPTKRFDKHAALYTWKQQLSNIGICMIWSRTSSPQEANDCDGRRFVDCSAVVP